MYTSTLQLYFVKKHLIYLDLETCSHICLPIADYVVCHVSNRLRAEIDGKICTTTLAIFIEGYDHILFLIVDFLYAHVKINVSEI